MSDIFLSHVEEDGQEVKDLAEGLEKAGYSAWYYERDAMAGTSYLTQVVEAINECQVLLVMISEGSLNSHQVDRELTHAFEKGKQLLPLLKDVTFAEFERQRPDWKMALGPSVAEPISRHGVTQQVERLVLALTRMGVSGTHDRGAEATPKTVFARIQLGPDDLLHELAFNKDLTCSYQLLLEGEAQPWQATAVVREIGGLFVILREAPLGALVRVRVSSGTENWESDFLPVGVMYGRLRDVP